MGLDDFYDDGLVVPSKLDRHVIAARSYLSSHHLYSAKHFVKLAKEIEDAHEGRSMFNLEHRAYVLGAVMCGVGFFDAAINEIYQDATDNHKSYVKPLGDDAIYELRRKWQETEGQGKFMRFLEKYQLALKCIGHMQFDRGRALYQDAEAAIDLRNALVHYKPETLTEIEQSRFEKNLRHKLKGKYPTNKLMRGSKNSFFPDHCLGYGCGQWVLDSLTAFTDEFFVRIKVIPNYQHFFSSLHIAQSN